MKKSELKQIIRELIKEQMDIDLPPMLKDKGRSGSFNPQSNMSPQGGSAAEIIKRKFSQVANSQRFMELANNTPPREIMQLAQPIPKDVATLAQRPVGITRPSGVAKEVSLALLIFLALFILREMGEI